MRIRALPILARRPVARRGGPGASRSTCSRSRSASARRPIDVDRNGFGGCPYTYISPKVPGYTPGWNSASIPFGPMQALGIGVWSNP